MKTRNLRSLTLQLAISQKRKSQYGNYHYRLVYFKSTITTCRLPYCHKCTLKKHPRQTQISPGRHKAPTRIHPQRGDLTTSQLSSMSIFHKSLKEWAAVYLHCIDFRISTVRIQTVLAYLWLSRVKYRDSISLPHKGLWLFWVNIAMNFQNLKSEFKKSFRLVLNEEITV